MSDPGLAARFVKVRAFAIDLFARHGLLGWSLAFNRRKQSMGLCVYGRRTIELSVHLIDRNSPDAVIETLLHEIAHALVGPGHAHDAVWKAMCLKVGAKPVRCGNADMPEGRWSAKCSCCGKRYERHRKPKQFSGWFCPPCGRDAGDLRWVCNSSRSSSRDVLS